MSPFEFTAHALARMHERGVSIEQVQRVIAQPLRTLAAAQGREEAHGLVERAGKSLLLRVILERGAVITVITVIATSKIEKYGGAA
jgi:uncharacterized DUF497 family protein